MAWYYIPGITYTFGKFYAFISMIIDLRKHESRMYLLDLSSMYIPKYAYHALNVDLAAWKSDRPRKLRNVWPIWRALT